VKVVEGSEIYNFPIHHSVHFSCKISSFYHSNSASPKEIRQAATPPALQRVGAPARAVRCLGVWAARAFPRSCRPEAGGHSEALRSPPTPRGARPLAGRPHSTVPCGPSRCSPVRVRRLMPLTVPRVRAGVLHPAGTSSPLLVKNRTASRLCPACVPTVHRPPSRPPAPLKETAASSGSGRLHTKSISPPPSLAPTVARRRTRLPHRAATSPAQRSRRPPPLAAGAPLAGPLPAPTKHRNQPPGTRGSFPARARPVPAACSPEFGRIAAGRCPGTQLRAPKFLQGLNCEPRVDL
jgi:hypothetical protein